MDCCCIHSNRGNSPFALVSFQLCPPVAVTRQPYQKHLAWRGRGGRNPSAYYVAFLVFVCLFSFSPVSFSWLKALFDDFLQYLSW